MFMYPCLRACLKAPRVALLLSILVISNTQAQETPGGGLLWWHAQGVLNAEGEGRSAEAAADAAIAYKGYGYGEGVHRTGACTYRDENGSGIDRWIRHDCPLADKNGTPLSSIVAIGHVVFFPGLLCTADDPSENCQYRPDELQAVSDKSLGQPTDYCPVGNPINQLTGNKLEISVDYQSERWSGSLGGLVLQRTYNSQDSQPANRFGSGWRSSVEQRLVTHADNLMRIGVQRPDGRVLNFVGSRGPAGSVVYLPDNDVNDNLIGLGPGLGWTYRVAADQSTEIYGPTGLLLSITSREGVTRRFTYSDADTPTGIAPRAGLLLSIVEAGGSLSFAYDSQAHVTAVTTGPGETLHYGYDSEGRLRTVTWPDGHTRTYLYNEPAHTHGADLPTALTGILDENGARYATYQYDSRGRAVSSEHAGGAGKVSLAYGDSQSSVSDALGSTRTYAAGMLSGSYKITGLDRSAPGCPTAARSVDYDNDGNVVRRNDFNGVVTTYSYSQGSQVPGVGYRRLNLETQRVEADGSHDKRTISTQWHTQWRKPTIVAGPKRIVRYSYDAAGNLSEVSVHASLDLTGAQGLFAPTVGSPRRWTWTYNDKHRVLTRTEPQGGVTRYSYYTDTADGHIADDLHQVTDALGHTLTYDAYDAHGRVTRLRDTNGVITDFTYHSRGWLLHRTVRVNTDGSPSPDDAITRIAYDAVGQIVKVTDADGVAIGYSYDDAHRLTDITDALGHRVHYTLDPAGNAIKEDSFGADGILRRSLSRTYNTLGQLASIKDGIGRLIFDASDIDSYDSNDNLLRSSDGQGIQRQHDYDPFNRLIGTLDNYRGIDAATQDTAATFAYDGRDRLEGVTDPDGLSTIYQVNGLDNLTRQDSPDSGTAVDTYDIAGNVITHTDGAGRVTTRRYDVLNRVTDTSYSHTTEEILYRYDESDSVTGCERSYPIGRLTRATDGVVTTTYCYDAFGHVTQKRQRFASRDDITQYRTTAAGRLAGMTYPSGTQVRYTRNVAGQVTAMSTTSPRGDTHGVVSDITYLPFGPIASYTLGNGQTVTRTYDANYRLADLTSAAFTLQIARDTMGQPTRITSNAGNDAATENYSYDPLYRLTAIKDATGAVIETYSYNKTGDRLSKTGRGLATGDYGYQTGTHWLTQIGNTARDYSAAGHTIGSTAGGQSYRYDYTEHRLNAIYIDDGTWWGVPLSSYTYDGFGKRVSKQTGSPNYLNRRFVYNEASQLIGEYSDDYETGWPIPSYVREYLWLDTLPMGVVDVSKGGSVVNYVIADELDTPRAITNANGQTIWYWPMAGNPFGERPPVSNVGYVYNLRFPGQYYDAESGLHYNIHRYYDPTTGRYGQTDPIGLDGGWSTYGYALNSPLYNSDPNGLATIAAGGQLSAQISATFAISGQLSLSWNSNTPMDLTQWRVGGIFSVTPLTVGSTGVGASAGALFTYSPTNNVSTLNGWGTVNGGSGGGGSVLGYDVGNIADTCNRTHNVFIGAGLKITGTFPGEFHSGASWTAAGSFAPWRR